MTSTTSAAQPPATGGELPEIFRALAKQKRTGTLKVSGAENRTKYIYFNAGEIDFLKSRKAKTVIGRALLKRRKVTEPDLGRALKRHLATGEKLGKCCVSLGLCREEDVREALAFQAIEEVTDLLTWKSVKSEFHRGEPPLDIFDFDDLAVRMRLSPDALVREAERRVRDLEQVRRAVPSFADIYAPSPEAMYAMKQPADGSPEAELLRFLDGEHDVEEVLERVRLSDIEALRALDRLVRSGEVVALGPAQLFTVAVDCEKYGNLEKSYRLFTRAEEGGFDQLDLPNRVAKVADALGKRDEAVRRYIEFAARCVQEELPEAAVAAYRKALEADPGSLEAMERLVAVLVKLHKGDEAVALLKQLTLRYDPETDREKLHRAWAEVLKLAPEDTDAHRAVAGAYVASGDKVQAIIELEELAAIFLSRGRVDDAIGVLKEILSIDPECVEAHLELAATFTNIGSVPEAVAEYERLAESLSKTGIGGEATNWQFLIDINEKIVSLAPENRRARQWLAQAYGQKAEVDKAVAHYQGLVEALERGAAPAEELIAALRAYVTLKGDDFDACEKLGKALATQGKKDEAAGLFRDARESALKAHRFDVVKRASEAGLAITPFDLDAHRALARIAEIEKDEARAFAKWRDVASLAAAAGVDDEAVEAAHRALEIAKDADLRRTLAGILERKGRGPEAAKALVEAAREDFQAEDYGRARKAAERAAQLDPSANEARDLLFMLEGRREAAQRAAGQSGHSKIAAAPEKPPAKPTITGGNPDVTIIDRPRRKYGSVTGVSEKLRAIRDPSQSVFGAAAAAADAPPEPATDNQPKKTLGAAAKLKALKGGGFFGGAGGGAPVPAPAPAPAEPFPAPIEAAASTAPAEAEAAPAPALAFEPPPVAEAVERPPGLPAISPSEPVAVQQSAKKAMSAADRLKRLKGGGAPEASPEPSQAPPKPTDATAALAEKLQKSEAGEVQAGGAKKAMSAAAKLKSLGKKL